MKRLLSERKKEIEKYFPFMVAFLIMVIYLMPKENMYMASMDAEEIWKTIKSLGTENIYGSYVLYKGFNAIYPYAWLYRLSVIIGANEWLFVKVFYCFAFAYVTAIGFPKLIEYLLGCVIPIYRKIIFIVLCFAFWEYTHAFSNMMVDLISMMYFILLVNASMSILEEGLNIRKGLWIGFLIGLNLCTSGQYSVPTYCVCIFLIIVTLKKMWNGNKKNIRYLLGNITAIVAPAFSVKQYNNYFLNNFVGGLKAEGAWIPSGLDWLEVGLARFMRNYRSLTQINITSNRIMAIYQDYFGIEKFEEIKELMLSGGYHMTISEYLNIVLHYPIDFALNFLDKFFLVLSPDQGSFRFVPLFLFYSFIFVACYIGVKKCRKMHNIFNAKFWIGFAFCWTIVPLLVMSIEPRCCMQIQGLIMAMAIFDDFLWDGCKKVYKTIIIDKKQFTFKELEVPYAFILYCVFILFCFMHMGRLYDGMGLTDASILISF